MIHHSSLLVAFAILSIFVPGGIAGPACVRKFFQTPDCLVKCKEKWGYPGNFMGTSHWGSVIGPSTDSMDVFIAKACGLSGGVTNAAGSSPSLSVTDSSNSSSTSAFDSQRTQSSQDGSSTTASNTGSTGSTTTVPQTTSLPSNTPTPTFMSTSTLTAGTQSTRQPSSSTSTSQPSSSTNSPFGSSSNSSNINDIHAYLDGHNQVRAQHGAPALTWSETLATRAQAWASNCVFQRFGDGVNLAAGIGGSYTIASAIESWANEFKFYDSHNPQPSQFTQVVWNATTQVGCAVQVCDGIFDPSFGKAQYYVCQYSPAGNVDGQYSNNILG